MRIKSLNKRLFLMVATLLMVMPLSYSLASSFDGQAVVELINKDRVERKIKPLTMNDKLTKAAQQKARDMFANNYFAHTSPVGVTPWNWIEKSGYDYSFAGENLAINFVDAESQHIAFMKSESHRKNILNEKYKEIGVAVVSGAIDGKQTIITVQEFGAKPIVAKVEKKIAGAADVSQVKVSTQNNQLNFQIVSTFDANEFAKFFKIIGEKAYAMAYVFIPVVALLTMLFLAIEILVGHVHFAARLVSMHSRKHKVKLVDEKMDYKLSFPENMDDEVNLKKRFLEHMKFRN